jgi:thioredoxin 1
MVFTSFVIKVVIGAGIGAALGYFGQCSSGTCPLTATWWRGALFGGLIGLMFAGTSSGTTGNTSTGDDHGLVKEITNQEFDVEVARATAPVLVDFYAPWCGPCKRMAPTIGALAKEFQGSVSFVKVNVDNNPELARRYAVQGVPTLMLFQGGQRRDQVVGLVQKTELRDRITRILGKVPTAGESSSTQ